MLALSFLGSFAAGLHGQPLTDFATDKVRALLAFLAVEAGHPHLRSALAALLWPEMPEPAARRNLSQTLTRLKRTLGDGQNRPPYLLIRRDGVHFNPESQYQLDVAQFQKLSASQAIAELEEAAALYRGDFLAGFSLADNPVFEEWLLLKREALHRQALDLFYRLTAHFMQQARYRTAEGYARRQLALEPWREEAHQQLMRALALGGRRNAALAHFKECSRLLAQELAVAPSAATVDLFERIRSGALRSRPGRDATPPHNLPPIMPFVGRAAELRRLHAWLGVPERRLVTLLGPGGIGKTRLALEAARRQLNTFRDGVRFVSLAPLEPGAAPSAVNPIVAALVDALKLVLHSDLPVSEQLLTYLEAKEMLLVLDNLEHLTRHSEVVGEILRRAPGVKIVVTSHQRLNLQEEWLFLLEGMAVPPAAVPVSELAEYDAVRLFARQARQVRPDFDLAAEADGVVRICRLVGGLPLALVLAAAWVRLMPCDAIATEIARNLDFLADEVGNLPARQRSLRAVFDHAWRLLSETEQAVFRRLAVFRSRFKREAAVVVTGASLVSLASLVDKSLLQVHGANYYQVHPLLHQYAEIELRRLPDEEAQTRDRHCHLYLDLLQRQEASMQRGRLRQAQMAITADLDNVLAAWRWALKREQVAKIGPVLFTLFFFYETKGWYQQGDERFGQLVDHWRSLLAQPEAEAEQRAVLSLALAYQGWFQMRRHVDQSNTLFKEGLAILEGLPPAIRHPRAYAFLCYGNALMWMGEPRAARGKLEESLRLGNMIGDVWVSGTALSALGHVMLMLGKPQTAEQYLQDSIVVLTQIGNQLNVTYSQSALARIAQMQGHLEQANKLYLECLQIRTDIGAQPGIAFTLRDLGEVARLRGELGQARDYYERSLALGQEIGLRTIQAEALHGLGSLSLQQAEFEAAAAFFQRSLAVSQAGGLLPYAPPALTGLGWAALGLGQREGARQRFTQALQLESGAGRPLILLDAVAGLAHSRAAAGDLEDALAVISVVLGHPAATPETRPLNSRLLEELKAALSPAAVNAAQAWATENDLDGAMARILKGWERVKQVSSLRYIR